MIDNIIIPHLYHIKNIFWIFFKLLLLLLLLLLFWFFVCFFVRFDMLFNWVVCVFVMKLFDWMLSHSFSIHFNSFSNLHSTWLIDYVADDISADGSLAPRPLLYFTFGIHCVIISFFVLTRTILHLMTNYVLSLYYCR